MLAVNLADGSTRSYNLAETASAALWEHHSADPALQRSIRALSIFHSGKAHTITRPSRAGAVSFSADLVYRVNDHADIIGERISVQMDDVRLTALVYWSENPSVVRMNMERTGKCRWAPSRVREISGL